MSTDKNTKIDPSVVMLIGKVLIARTRPGYQAIASFCGVSYSWVAKFSQGEIPDPKISLVKKLQQFFDDNPSGFFSDFDLPADPSPADSDRRKIDRDTGN